MHTERGRGRETAVFAFRAPFWSILLQLCSLWSNPNRHSHSIQQSCSNKLQLSCSTKHCLDSPTLNAATMGASAACAGRGYVTLGGWYRTQENDARGTMETQLQHQHGVWNMGYAGTTQGVEHGPCWNNTRRRTWAMLEQRKAWNMGHAGTQGMEHGPYWNTRRGTWAMLEQHKAWNMGHAGTTQSVEHGSCWNNTRCGTWAMLEQRKV